MIWTEEVKGEHAALLLVHLVQSGSPVGLERRPSGQTLRRTLETLALLSPETLKHRHQRANKAQASAGAGCCEALHMSMGRGCVRLMSPAESPLSPSGKQTERRESRSTAVCSKNNVQKY